MKGYEMENCKQTSAPMVSSATFCSDTYHHLFPDEEHRLYRSMVGSLMYAADSPRPDISALRKTNWAIHSGAYTSSLECS